MLAQGVDVDLGNVDADLAGTRSGADAQVAPGLPQHVVKVVVFRSQLE